MTRRCWKGLSQGAFPCGSQSVLSFSVCYGSQMWSCKDARNSKSKLNWKRVQRSTDHLENRKWMITILTRDFGHKILKEGWVYLVAAEVFNAHSLLSIICFAPSIPRVSVALIRIVGGAVGCHPIFPSHNSVSLFASF
jgi:hypothetical protein